MTPYVGPSSSSGSRQFFAGLLAILAVAILLRGLFPTADPPWHSPVGITWHDEGPWVHNARNRALFGQWSLDRWNPMYLAPVFTGLEYVSFATVGVGTWQARLVSEAMGTISVVALALGVAAMAGRRAGLIAGALLATNYIYVMWNRAALMEATMTAFMVVAWAAYAIASADTAGLTAFAKATASPPELQRRRKPRLHSRTVTLGLIAGLAAWLAFFTKAAAAFFIGALGLEALLTLWLVRREQGAGWLQDARVKTALWTIAGLIVAGLIALAIFVIPYWQEFRFYNWQMSVTRKPDYTVKAFFDRLSWIPIIHDFFTRQWLVTVLGVFGTLGLLTRWRAASSPERLLGLWIALGFTELIAHDVGNERRFIFFIPALVAFAATVLGRDRSLLPAEAGFISRRNALLATPLLLFAAYVVLGAILRVPFIYQVGPGVRLGAVAAVILVTVILLNWQRVVTWLSAARWPPASSLLLAGVIVGSDLTQFAQWAALRTYENVNASRLVGEWLPAGTLVHGKLANGLSLENRIRPVFVGRGFGNYEDRAGRRDIRYILTYVEPRLGYEGSVIRDVLEAHPGWRVIHEFDVAETANGHDRAALIQKP
jgi:4-amino-4-deoxy-L-arabinose transferase-like glycosyltransferase